MQKGYLRIPYAWFGKNAVWWRLTSEQRGALATLCSMVAYSDFEFETKYGKVPLKCGQMVTSVNGLAKMLSISESKVKTLLKKLKDEDVILIQSVKDAFASTLASTFARTLSQLTILTIKELQASPNTPIASTFAGTFAQDNNINKNNINKNINSRENNAHRCEGKSSIVITDEDRIPTKDFDTIKVAEMMDFVRLHKQEWTETFCMNHHITPEQFFCVYADFVRHCQNLGETVKTVKDTTSHFAKWYLVQKEKNKTHGTTSQNNSKRSAGFSTTAEEAERRRKFEEHIWQQLNDGGGGDAPPLPF